MEKATVLTRANKICRRSETDIDDILLEAILEISRRTGVLVTEATGSTTANQAYIAVPSDLAGRLIHLFYLDDDNPWGLITWSQYLHNNIEGYCLYKDRIYMRPNPSSAQTYHCEYSYLDDDVDSIELPDKYLAAVVRLTASKLYEKYERYQEASNQLQLYELELNRVWSPPTDPVCVYNGQEM